MCGIGGYWTPKESINLEVAYRMLETLKERGPDYSDLWKNEEKGLVILHSRLSVVDKSNKGNQPMSSYNKRFIITFNGEIYNHMELRKDIERQEAFSHWRSNSDTETLLEAISLWGLEKATKKLVGMFAFAIIDRENNKLYLVRDRLGEKPLFYYKNTNTIVFGSEIRTIEKHPFINKEIDKKSLNEYFNYGYINSEETIYKYIKKVKPGAIITFDYNNEFNLENKIYWSLSEIYKSNYGLYKEDQNEALNDLEKLLVTSIKGQMRADVPIGAFLSGGIDSSCVASIMQRISSQKINTFTLGFNEKSFDESEKARKISKHLGTNHFELKVNINDVKNLVPKISTMFDGPFGDMSQVPTYIISAFAREHVTVALSGDGGDELFGGYNRYGRVANIYKLLKILPSQVSTILHLIKNTNFIRKYNSSTSKFAKLKNLLDSKSSLEFYSEYTRLFHDDSLLKDQYKIKQINKFEEIENLGINNIIDLAMFYDTTNYLPEDILTKVDRMAMRSSLETRIPLLDHRIVEYCWSLPQKFKGNGSNQKKLLTQLAYKYIPEDLLKGKKKGFNMPVGEWIRGPLKEWAGDLLSQSKIDQDGILIYKGINNLWEEHITGKKDWSYKLWSILALQSWLHRQ